MDKKDILNDLRRSDGKLNSSKCKQNYFDKSGYTRYVNEWFPWAKTLREQICCLNSGIDSKPVCPVCGKSVGFASEYRSDGGYTGYRKYCSKSCARKDVRPADYDSINDNTIINKLVNPSTGKLYNNRLQDKYLKEHGLYEYLAGRFSDIDISSKANHMDNPKGETVYRILHHIETCPVCPVCGIHPAKYMGWNKGYQGCSYRCRNIQEFSGVISDKDSARTYMSNPDGSFNKNACRPEYAGPRGLDDKLREWWPGYDRKDALWCLWNRQDRLPSCPECGTDLHPVNTLDLSILNGRCCSARCAKRQERRRTVEKLDSSLELIFHDDGTDDITIKNLCYIHGDIRIKACDVPMMFGNRLKPDRYSSMVVCPECNPFKTGPSGIEVVIAGMLDSFGVRYEQHYRKLPMLKPKELDFWIPDFNTGIECNGVHWHSGAERRDIDRRKRLICRHAGIRLLTFWEDDIKDHPDRIQAYLRTVFNRNSRKIGARECEIKDVPSQECREFLELYHLQGSVNAPVRLGLYKDGELLEVMTFGKRRRNMGARNSSDTEWELYRLCTKDDCTVSGGASRLFSYFKKHYEWSDIISYCHAEISDGTVYRKLGFVFRGRTSCGYSYVKDGSYRRINRFTLRKSEIDDGSGRTADEILESLGYSKCWDAGNTVWKISAAGNLEEADDILPPVDTGTGDGLFCGRTYANPTDFDVISETVKDGRLLKGMLKDDILKALNLYDYMENRFPDIDIHGPKNKKAEIVWRIYNHAEERPVCPVCGRPAKFTDWKSGYSGCSYRCNGLSGSAVVTDKESAISLISNPDGSFNKNRAKASYAGPRGLDSWLMSQWPDYDRNDALWCLWNNREKLPACPECGRPVHPLNTLDLSVLDGRCCSHECENRLSRRMTVKKANPSIELIFHDDGTGDITFKNLCSVHGDVRVGKENLQTMFTNRLRKELYEKTVACPICNPIIRKPRKTT